MRSSHVLLAMHIALGASSMGCSVEIPAELWDFDITYTGPIDAGRSQFCGNVTEDGSWSCTDWVPGNVIQWKGMLNETRIGLDPCTASEKGHACGYTFNIEFLPWPHFAVTQERGALFAVGSVKVDSPFPTDLLLVDNGLRGGNFALKRRNQLSWQTTP
ncbi:hypothetical protein HYV74_03245 [Candidatus Uhrbacteria bacterium]|nr:hypothetical protein [Candidatus Uhrbacteria bacterium]